MTEILADGEFLSNALDKIMVGTSGFGGMYSETSDEACREVVKQALSYGWRRFDTAPHYGLGLSEERLGRALQGQDAEVYTKVGRVVRSGVAVGPRVDVGNLPGKTSIFLEAPSDRYAVLDLSRDGVLASLAGSRERLGGATIAGVRVHDPEQLSELEEEAFREAFPTLREESLEVSIGTNDVRVATRALPCVDAVLLANRFNLLEQSGATLLAECHRINRPVHLAGVYASGLLAGGDTYAYHKAPPAMVDKASKWSRLITSFAANKKGPSDLKAVALAFAFVPRAVDYVVVGLRSKAEVVETYTILNDLRYSSDFPWLDLFSAARDQDLLTSEAFDLVVQPRFSSPR